MFKNIGTKIKALVSIVAWIQIAICIIAGIIVMAIDRRLSLLGIVIIILGVLFSWLSSFMLYAWGQLVENTDKLVEQFCKLEHLRGNDEMMNSLLRWKNEGLITEEDYLYKLQQLQVGESK